MVRRVSNPGIHLRTRSNDPWQPIPARFPMRELLRAPNAEQKSQLRHEPPGSVRYLNSASTPSARRSKTPTLALVPFLMNNRRAMSAPSSPSQSAEDYLERIHELIEEKGYARVVDIASSLEVKQASVTSMVQKLGDLGYLNYEKYRGLVLTEKGKKVATNIQRRHETLSRFFSLFGLDAKTQKLDIEGIEHHLSAETVAVLADLARFFEESPDTLKQFRKSRKPAK
jgi:Mn-dependent DtxR family transcriptional regulator